MAVRCVRQSPPRVRKRPTISSGWEDEWADPYTMSPPRPLLAAVFLPYPNVLIRHSHIKVPSYYSTSPPRTTSIGGSSAVSYRSPPRRYANATMGVPPVYVGDKRASAYSTTSAGCRSNASTGSAAGRKSVQAILLEVQHHTGWRAADLSQPYCDFVKYRKVMPEDLLSSTWVDILGKEGKSLRRNAGILRYLGPVGFADGIWVGMEVSGPPLQGNANDGMVFGVRYFDCEAGRGLFVKQKWVQRSFLQRPREHGQLQDPTGGPYSIAACFHIEASPLHGAGIIDVARTTSRTSPPRDQQAPEDDKEPPASPDLDAPASHSRSSSKDCSTLGSSHTRRSRHSTQGSADYEEEDGPHNLTGARTRTLARSKGSQDEHESDPGAQDGYSPEHQHWELDYEASEEQADEEVNLYFTTAMRYLEQCDWHSNRRRERVRTDRSEGVAFLEQQGLMEP